MHEKKKEMNKVEDLVVRGGGGVVAGGDLGFCFYLGLEIYYFIM